MSRGARTNELGQPIGPPLPDWSAPPAPPREPIEGRFCRLEPLEAARHAEALFEADALDADGRSWTYLPYGPFPDPSAYRTWIEAECTADDPLFYALVDRRSERPVGVASYLRIAPEIGSVEVGHLHFSPLAQRTPVATDAMAAMMRRVFELGYRRYEWKCDALNAPSRSAAQRLGFRFEGIFRQHTIAKGRSRDTAWFSILDSEWPALERALEAWLAPENFDAEGRQRTRLSERTAPLVAAQSTRDTGTDVP